MTDFRREPSARGAEPSRPPRVCIVTVDPSGDAIGAALAEALHRRGAIEIIGAGGAAMRAAGVELVADTTQWTALGAVGWLCVLYRAIPGSHLLRWRINALAPDLLIPIDSGGFNVPVARTLRRWLGLKVLYYIPPRCWSPRWRVEPLAKIADFVAAPFPWNADGDDGTGRVRFVGHPAADLLAKLPPQDETRRQLGLDANRLTLAVLPGSRRFEIGVHVPILIEAIRLLRGHVPELQVILSRAPSVPPGRLEGWLRKTQLADVQIVEGAGRALRTADAALVCLGTATLEACALGCPMVTFYRGTRLMSVEYLFNRPRTPYYALPNIIANDAVVPEMTQRAMTPEGLADKALPLLRNPEARKAAADQLASVAQALGGVGASDRAAQAVFDALNDEWHSRGGKPVEPASPRPEDARMATR